MTIGALEKITIGHLRGSVKPFTLAFERKKKLTIIYGENGTGKSTICDAFDFLGNGIVGSLNNRGLNRTEKYWPSAGKNKTDVQVKLDTSSGTCTATFHKSSVVVLPQENRPSVRVLRRKQILELVEATAGERYNAIKHFIDVTAIENAEKALIDLARSIEGSQNSYVTRIQENRDEIGRYWESAGSPVEDMLAWAKQESTQNIAHTEEEAKILDGLQKAYRRLADFSDEFQQNLVNHAKAKTAALAAQEAFAQQQSKIAQDTADIVEILRVAQSYFHKIPNPPVCPLCGSDEKVNGLAARINEKLTFHKEWDKLHQLQDSKTKTERALEQAENNVKESREKSTAHKSNFARQLEKVQPLSGIQLPTHPIPNQPESWPAWLEENNGLVESWKSAEASRREFRNRQIALEKALKNLKDNEQKQKELCDLLPKLNQALDIVREERHSFTDNILSQISTEVGRLYETVHRGEGLDKISIALDPNKRASLELGVNFNSEDVPPQAYFSESHLDTLGLCVFLALAGMNTPEDTILVLDDVLASVDERHADRLIQMLYEESKRFGHCIISTHYKPWRHKYRWGWLANGQCQFIELSGWNSSRGVMLSNSVTDISRLRMLLDEHAPDPQLVCAKAGVILEAVLDFLTQLYESSLPRHSRGYTLGDLLPAIDKKLRPALKIERLTIDADGNSCYQSVPLQPYFDELHKIAQVRNIFGCHFNQLSSDLLDADALRFGEQVYELAEHLLDQNVGWPRSPKSGVYWSTTGDSRRLYPLRKPG